MDTLKSKWGKLSSDWDNSEKFVVYGFGNTAKVYFDNLSKYVHFCFIIDNSKKLKGKLYNDIPIYTYEEAKDKIGKTKIIVMAETIAYNKIVNALKVEGYNENIDFVGVERFICEWFFKNLNKLNLMEVHTTVTTICTFNCKHCNMFMPYYKRRKQYSLYELKNNIDILFKHIDYLYKYQLVGGEPFLNHDLASFLIYLNHKYTQKIGTIRIITNGGVIPNELLLDAIKKCNAEINISSYLDEIDYQEKFEEVVERFDKWNINYKIISTLRWRDFGFPTMPCSRTKEEGRRHMLLCGTTWHGLNNGKLYYCNSAWSAGESGLYKNLETDFLNLKELRNSIEDKISLLEFCLGDKEEYNSFCRICGGCGEDNNNIVKAGEQV